MELMDAIYNRRSVRAYTDKPVERGTVETLIGAAIQAPSAMNQQPWAFAVIQGAKVLGEYSDRVKAHLLKTMKPQSPLYTHRDALASREFNVFYHAGTLIIICAKPNGLNVEEDCCLAAQNLMLAAYGLGLGTCPIGFARPWLNLARVKRDIGIPGGYGVVFPVVTASKQGLTACWTYR